jgi:sulfatase modifying factor 1
MRRRILIPTLAGLVGCLLLAVVSCGGSAVTTTVSATATTSLATTTTKAPEPTSLLMMIPVPAGTFQRDEDALNTSTVSAFSMSATEITRAQWTTVTGLPDPSDTDVSTGQNDPVQNVKWYQALVFCNKLSLREGLTPVYTISGSTNPNDWGIVPTGDFDATWDAVTANWSATGYRLPTEMEWMWAAMGARNGNTGYGETFAGSTGSNALDDYAWHSSNSGDVTHEVGSKLPNELGFYDMSGSVWEWCWGWAGDYPTGAPTNYSEAASRSARVNRGGSWSDHASNCSVAYRNFNYPYDQFNNVGFRVVCL